MLPAIAAASGGLAFAPAAALELGDIQVESSLGQPLRASVAYALAPDEMIDRYCISARSGAPGASRSGIAVSVANGVITLTGRAAVVEPIMAASVEVNCPYSPHMRRSYTMFIDPQISQTVFAATPEAIDVQPAAAAPASRRERPAASPASRAPSPPVEQGARYRVQPGDSLSRIAERLENREVGLQAAMSAIFLSNPDAFIADDPNKLKAGSWLDIPAMAGGLAESEPPASEPSVGAVARSAATTVDEARPPADVVEPAVGPGDAAMERTGERASEPRFAELPPGDVAVPVDAGVLMTEAASPAANRIVRPAAGKAPSSNGLLWLGAGGIAVLAGAVFFGRRLRRRFGSSPVGKEPGMTRPQSAQDTPRVGPIAAPDETMEVEEIGPAHDGVDFDLCDDSPTEENPALDADLVMGTGLDPSDDVDVNQDFGFAATTELDMELPETAARDDDRPETDIIPPPERAPDDLIVDSEVLPEDDEYDMSVVVDATKMPDPADVTERDLKAVPVEDIDQTMASDTYSIDEEVDFQILEKDYEDELSATQALNMEIEKAAAELAGRMDDIETADTTEDDAATAEVQLTDISDLDLTANLEAQNDELDDLDVTANIDADDKTLEMPAKDGTKSG